MKYTLFLLIVLASVAAGAKTHVVEMRNAYQDHAMVFVPAIAKINVGDQVIFEPTDMGHDLTSIFVPDGAKGFDGQTDEKVQVAFDKEGIYLYKCENHFSLGMVGIIQVGRPTNLKQAKVFAQKLSSEIILNKDRLTSYIKSLE